MSTTAPDEARLQEFLGRFVGDLGAAMHAPLVVIGDRLGLYRALAEGGPMAADELARRTGCAERYVAEWLAAQAASGYVEYDAAHGRFWMSPEQAVALADERSPAFVPGGLQVAMSVARDADAVEAAFRHGGGVGWHEHDRTLFDGTERFFRPSYAGHLVASWIPALDGVEAKLRQGAHVADVGCGYGASTLLMAEAFPASSFVGFDYHSASIEAAAQRAEEAGLGGRVRFEVAAADELPAERWDLVAYFDCFHDLGDPLAAATRAREAMAPDGTLMLVEPKAGDRLEENLNPLGRVFYSASTLICTPNALSQEGSGALGPMAGEARTREVVEAAGFRSFRRAAESPTNIVYEGRS